MTNPAPSDPERERLLWSQFRDGDVQAWSILLERYYRTLFSYGRRLGGERALLHDCIHELFIELWNRRRNLNPAPTSVTFYLLRSFRNKVLKELEKERNHLSPEEAYVPEEPEPSIEQWLTDQETAHINGLRLKQLLAELSPREREVLFLKFYENLSSEQIAELMAIRKQSVANLLHSALQRLRQRWEVSYGLPLLGLVLRWLIS